MYCCVQHRCNKWWKANEAGLSPAEYDKLTANDDAKWVCPKCKQKKAAKKAKKRAREAERDGAGGADGQPRFKIKLGGFS